MKVEVLYFKNCPNERPAVDRVQQALLDANVTASLVEVEVTSPEMAQQLGFLGSPTIRVDGLDVEQDARNATTFGFGCRTYYDAGTRSGLPSMAIIRQAIHAAAHP